MVFDLLGPNLEDLLNYCDRRFSLATAVLTVEQMLERIEHLHARNFIHRDIKPDNFVIGRESSSTIYMIDYGLAKRYRDSKSKQHIPFRENKSLIGTARYTSVNAHLGYEQSRRDDIEGLLYVSVYFLKGTLPWQGTRANTKKEKYDRIMDIKMSTPARTLCKGLPCTCLGLLLVEFVSFLDYAKGLGFEEKPDYNYLFRLLRQCVYTESNYRNKVFDWTIPSVLRSATVEAASGRKEKDEGGAQSGE
eukprot:TRINITY_DN11497_c0_g2_i3.p1 TRINITY_DN11497_c0_g2~~TRINITY_DN11497_c0_g2_i3.p1  ORF type:complete len:248 (-),score=38.23 TRINITY_DN11497_c0_g2_i3:456-1199(-)